MADTTKPTAQELQNVYDAKFRKWVAIMAIGGFFAYSMYASHYPPTLPGDATGQIISAWQSMACVCVGYYMSMFVNKTTSPAVAVSPSEDSKTTVVTESPKP